MSEIKVDMGSSGIKSLTVDFPSNSNKVKTEPKKVEKVVTSGVVTQKKTIGKKFLELFAPDDVGGITNYIIYEVLIPSAKNTMFDIVRGTFDMIKQSAEAAIFGENRPINTDRNRTHVSYNNYSSTTSPRREPSRSLNPKRYNFDDIVITDKAEAESVIHHLVDLTMDFGQATVSDLYDLVGKTDQFTDRRYGWTDLSRATTRRVRDGHLLVLPNPRMLD
jgi:hypothetical protein